MTVMRDGNRGQTKLFQVFRRMEIGEGPVCPRFLLQFVFSAIEQLSHLHYPPGMWATCPDTVI
jgi:hypothetical protein